DDRARLVRPRIYSPLEQRGASDPRRYRRPADRTRSRVRWRCAPAPGLGCCRRATGPLRPATGSYDGDDTHLALEGEYRIRTAEGEILCRPAFELYARLCQRYSLAAVEAICWIPRNQIEAAARLIWEARPVSYYAWSGHEQHANTTQTARAMSLLYA